MFMTEIHRLYYRKWYHNKVRWYLKGTKYKLVIYVRCWFLFLSSVWSKFLFMVSLPAPVLQSMYLCAVCVAVWWYGSLSGDPVAHFSDRSSASVSPSVFQERPHVSRCAASLVARWREGERCAVCVPPASTWPLTTRPVKVMLFQKHPPAHHYSTPHLFRFNVC